MCSTPKLGSSVALPLLCWPKTLLGMPGLRMIKRQNLGLQAVGLLSREAQLLSKFASCGLNTLSMARSAYYVRPWACRSMTNTHWHRSQTFGQGLRWHVTSETVLRKLVLAGSLVLAVVPAWHGKPPLRRVFLSMRFLGGTFDAWSCLEGSSVFCTHRPIALVLLSMPMCCACSMLEEIPD